jgi:hypothetical protein
MYMSSAAWAMSEEALTALLDLARSRNSSLNLTGMLIFSKGSFLQVLEGDKLAIDQVFQSICLDARHTSVYVIDKCVIEQRNFGNWTMGFHKLDVDIVAPSEPGFVGLGEVEVHVRSAARQRDLATDLLSKFAQL